MLIEETNHYKFELLLERTLQSLRDSPLTCTFADYFENHYAKRKEQWAMCYRKEATVNTNMYVEAFHRVLKNTSTLKEKSINVWTIVLEFY